MGLAKRVKRLVLEAHAKLNLGLWVVGRRDDGFHDIESLLVRLNLHDELGVTPATGVEGEVVGVPGVHLRGLAMGSDNLVVRAVRAYQEAAAEVGGVRLHLLKRIPVAAGLGGGSSDAVQALQAMARLYPSAVDLEALASDLGSDLSFFLSGHPAAWGRGRGNELEPAELPKLPVVLLNPGVEVSASEAYRLLKRFDAQPERVTFLERLSPSWEPGYSNSLQPGVVEEYPVVGEALEALRQAGLKGVLMSGSGSTCFGLAGSEQDALLIAEGLRERFPGWWVWAGWAGV